MKRTIGLVIGLSLLSGFSPREDVLVAVADTSTATEDQILLPSPPGRYRVGTVLRAFTDSSRAEVASPDSSVRRTLYTQIWYPADTESEMPASYFGNSSYRNGFAELEGDIWLDRFSRVRTNAIPDAALSTAQARYPVLFFSAGFGLSKHYNTQLLEGLASHGFVVFGIDLPYVNPVVTESGVPINSADSYWDGFPMTRGTDDFEAGKARLAFTDAYYSADYLFVYRQLQQLNAGSLFDQSLDLDRVAALGHSAGASTTFALMKRPESPFNAFVVYDVTLHADHASEQIFYPKQLLTTAPIYLFLLEYASVPPQEFIQSLNAELTMTKLVGTKHSSLTDIDFIRATAAGDAAAAESARRRVAKIIAYTVNFLGQNLHLPD